MGHRTTKANEPPKVHVISNVNHHEIWTVQEKKINRFEIYRKSKKKLSGQRMDTFFNT